MRSEKNISKWSILKAEGDINIGDKTVINNFLRERNSIVIFVIAMDKEDYLEIKDVVIDTLEIRRDDIFCNKKLYIRDNDDLIDDIDTFFTSSFGKHTLLESHYDDDSDDWKPFVHDNPNAENKTIKTIIDGIFRGKNIEIICMDTSLDNLISKYGKEIVFDIFERAILIVDPISLSHPTYKEFFEEVYHSVEIGGIISINSYSSSMELRRFSTLLLKRLAYRWDRKSRTHTSKSFYFSTANERNLEENLLNACRNLIGSSVFKDPFGSDFKNIPDSMNLGKKN